MATPISGPTVIDHEIGKILATIESLHKEEEKQWEKLRQLGEDTGRSEFMLFRNCSRELLQWGMHLMDEKEKFLGIKPRFMEFLAEKCAQSLDFRKHVEENGKNSDGSLYFDLVWKCLECFPKPAITEALEKYKRKLRKIEREKREAEYDKKMPETVRLAHLMAQGGIEF